MKTKQEYTSSDLEDGEIREEGFEDISDCSLSEIVTMKKDLESEEEVDIDLLREEALKSMHKGEEENNEEELEEELCRLEALKSLLKNIEANEKLSSVKEIEKKRRPKRKRKDELKRKPKKCRETSDSNASLSPHPDVTNKIEDEDSKKQKIENVSSRPWYPTTEFALICTLPDELEVSSPKTSIEAKCGPLRQTVNHVRTSNVRVVNYVKQSSPLKNRLVKNNVVKSPPVKPNPFKRVTKHSIRKFDSTLPINPVKPFAQQNTFKRGKYKLVNNTNYVTNKFPALKVNGLRNHSSSKSPFSINRLKCPQVTFAPKKFLIDLDDQDSDQEEICEPSNTANGAKTPLICDIKAKRDKVPTEEQPNKIESKTLVIKDCSSNAIVQGDRSGTNSSSQSDIERESVVDPPPRDATLVDSRKNESAFEDDKTTSSSKSDDFNVTIDTNERDTSVLKEAEGCLVTIREKLLSDLGELDRAVKRNAIEQEKLNALLKKLDMLKSMVAKFETKIKLQQSRLSANVACFKCLFNGVQTRTLTCSKFEEVCRTVGKRLTGPRYKPPSTFECVIAEKRQSIDLSKCQAAVGSK